MTIELPSSFGTTLLNCINGGVLGETLAQFALVPFSHSLSLRCSIVGGSTRDHPRLHSRASESGPVLHAVLNRDCHIDVSNSAKISFPCPVVSFDLLKDIVAVGLANGCFELWNLTSRKCLHRYFFPSGVIPSLVSANEGAMHVVPNKGKCLVSFDSLAALSGVNTSPVVADLFISESTCMSSRDNLVATVGDGCVLVTDWHSHTNQSIAVNAEKVWWTPTGHLFILTTTGALMDASWSNGLVGVAAKQPRVGSSMVMHQIQQDIKLADCAHGLFASVGIDNRITICYIEQGRYPVSPLNTELTILQEESGMVQDIVGISIVSIQSVAIFLQSESGELSIEYIKVVSFDKP